MTQIAPLEIGPAVGTELTLADPPLDPESMSFSVASDIDEVTQAWRLVFASYLSRGLIDDNEYAIHTVPQARHRDTAVLLGRIGSEVISTLSVIPDGPLGLPLDSVYPAELRLLRERGQRLVEAGLLADRWGNPLQSFHAVRDLMRLCFCYALERRSDIVIGVHPHHTGFYRRYWGFEPIGPERTYSAVKNHPVVLMRLRTLAALERDPLPRGVRHVLAHPVPADAFSRRFDFSPALVSRSAVDRYLKRQARSLLSRLGARMRGVKARVA